MCSSKQNRSLPRRPFRLEATYRLLPSCLAARRYNANGPLGAKTAVVSSVGEDVFGRETMENFHKFGVNTECVKVTNCDWNNQL